MDMQKYFDMPTKAYFALGAFWVIQIKEIIYGIDDRLVFTVNREAHRVKIYDSVKRGPYFKYHNMRIYLSECMRTDI